MRKTVLTAALLFIVLLLAVTFFFPKTSSSLGDYQCPVNSSLIYFYHNGCGACTLMEPLINDLPGRGCSVTKLDVTVNQTEVIEWDVMYTPTMIVCGQKHVGAVSASELETIINTACS